MSKWNKNQFIIAQRWFSSPTSNQCLAVCGPTASGKTTFVKDLLAGRKAWCISGFDTDLADKLNRIKNAATYRSVYRHSKPSNVLVLEDAEFGNVNKVIQFTQRQKVTIKAIIISVPNLHLANACTITLRKPMEQEISDVIGKDYLNVFRLSGHDLRRTKQLIALGFPHVAECPDNVPSTTEDAYERLVLSGGNLHRILELCDFDRNLPGMMFDRRFVQSFRDMEDLANKSEDFSISDVFSEVSDIYAVAAQLPDKRGKLCRSNNCMETHKFGMWKKPACVDIQNVTLLRMKLVDPVLNGDVSTVAKTLLEMNISGDGWEWIANSAFAGCTKNRRYKNRVALGKSKLKKEMTSCEI